MSFEALKNLTPSTRGNGSNVLVPKWIEQIETDGYAQIAVYHNVKETEDEVKSMVARKLLGKTYPTLYFIHATSDDGKRFLVVSPKKALFKSMKWDFKTYEHESE